MRLQHQMHKVYFPTFTDSSMTHEQNYVVGMAGYLNVVNIVTIDNNINVRSILTLVLVETEPRYRTVALF
jgi:hypothetical protein